jgi:hypothetical protein
LRLDPKLLREIEDWKDRAVVDENNSVRFRMFEGTSKSDWIRILLRIGLDQKIYEFHKKKNEIQDRDRQETASQTP